MGFTENAVNALQAIIDWADLALENPSEFNSHGVRNLDGPVFDKARAVLARRLNRMGARHAYRPYKEYPWFCAHCGYPQHEPLQHGDHFPEEPILDEHDAALIDAAWRLHSAPLSDDVVERAVDRIVRDVAELPDRTSPDIRAAISPIGAPPAPQVDREAEIIERCAQIAETAGTHYATSTAAARYIAAAIRALKQGEGK